MVMNSFRVLLIDDEKDIHRAFQKIFENEISFSTPKVSDDLFDDDEVSTDDYKLELISAYSGEEGIDIFTKQKDKNEPVHLVVCDMRMPPGMNGKDTLVSISRMSKNLVAIICTAYSDYSADDIKREMTNNPFLGWVEKPFLPQDLRDIIFSKLEIFKLSNS